MSHIFRDVIAIPTHLHNCSFHKTFTMNTPYTTRLASRLKNTEMHIDRFPQRGQPWWRPGLEVAAFLCGQSHAPEIHQLLFGASETNKLQALCLRYALYLRGIETTPQVDHREFVRVLESMFSFSTRQWSAWEVLQVLERGAIISTNTNTNTNTDTDTDRDITIDKNTKNEPGTLQLIRRRAVSSGPIAALVYVASRRTFLDAYPLEQQWATSTQLTDEATCRFGFVDVGTTMHRGFVVIDDPAKGRNNNHEKPELPYITVTPTVVDQFRLEDRITQLQTLLDNIQTTEATIVAGKTLVNLLFAVEMTCPAFFVAPVTPIPDIHVPWVVDQIKDMRRQLCSSAIIREQYISVLRQLIKTLPMDTEIDVAETRRLYACEYIRLRVLEASYLLQLPPSLATLSGSITCRTELREVHHTIAEHVEFLVRLDEYARLQFTHFFPHAIQCVSQSPMPRKKEHATDSSLKDEVRVPHVRMHVRGPVHISIHNCSPTTECQGNCIHNSLVLLRGGVLSTHSYTSNH